MTPIQLNGIFVVESYSKKFSLPICQTYHRFSIIYNFPEGIMQALYERPPNFIGEHSRRRLKH